MGTRSCSLGGNISAPQRNVAELSVRLRLWHARRLLTYAL